MKTGFKIFFLINFIVLFKLNTVAQEFESDLFDLYYRNTIQSFWESPHNRMTISTFRVNNNVKTEELTTTYKKSKISAFRIGFTTIYTKHYLLEDRKKSTGQFTFLADGHIRAYNRTDIDNANLLTGTIYHNFTYSNGVITADQFRYKEYIKKGAVEMDSVVTKDSLIYTVSVKNDTIYQKNTLEKETQTVYIFEGKKFIEKQNQFPGYKEIYRYTYNKDTKVEKIEITLQSDEGNESKNYYLIKYNANGLISNIQYFDNKNTLIEEKVFTYK